MKGEILALQHVPYETPGLLLDWARERGHGVRPFPAPDTTTWPDPAGLAGVFVMGGPMGVADRGHLPWLAREIDWLTTVVRETTLPVVGICLGSQILAHLLGSPVHPGDGWEIGFHPVESSRGPLEVFHWHQDRFDTPAGAEHLLRSAACPDQGFLAHGRLLGLQCHPEVTPPIIEALLAENTWIAEATGGWIQAPEVIRQRATAYPPPETREWLFAHLDRAFAPGRPA